MAAAEAVRAISRARPVMERIFRILSGRWSGVRDSIQVGWDFGSEAG
jgi:hypothetical protein